MLYRRIRPGLFSALGLGLWVLALCGRVSGQDTEPVRVLTGSPFTYRAPSALNAAQEQNWRTARARFEAERARLTDWRSAAMRHAVEGSILCSTNLGAWDEALALAREYVAQTKGTLEECLGLRFLAGLIAQAPHDGARRAGKFVRGAAKPNGDSEPIWIEDRAEAVRLYEQAREALARLAAQALPAAQARLVHAERIGVNFDLASTLRRPCERHPSAFQVAQEWWQPRAEGGQGPADLPSYFGMPTDGQGQARFLARAERYGASLTDGQKILFLLAEIETLDRTPTRADAARALFRRALIARSLTSEDLARHWTEDKAWFSEQRSSGIAFPPAGFKRFEELADDEALVVVSGQLRVLTLPSSESPIALLRELLARYPRSPAADDAAFTIASIHRERRQYHAALQEFEDIAKRTPASSRRADAQKSVQELRAPSVGLAETRTLLPGQAVRLQLKARNASTVELRARRLDLGGLMRREMAQGEIWRGVPGGSREQGRRAWEDFAREEVAHWRVSVPGAGGPGLSEWECEAPLGATGAYLIEARVAGSSRVAAVVQVISADALVCKWEPSDALIFLLDARDGEPRPQQGLHILEVRSGQNKHFDRAEARLRTDAAGAVRYRRRFPGSQVHVLFDDGIGGLAATGLSNYSSPPDPRLATPAFRRQARLVCDRSAYRPGSTVRFRLWIRDATAEGFAPPRAGEALWLEVESADDTIAEVRQLLTDEAGGVSGEFAIPVDARLGVWRFAIYADAGKRNSLGSATVAVEEYRKPEIELAVRPDQSVIRVGARVKATIQANYYFGAPVGGAKTHYTVQRRRVHLDPRDEQPPEGRTPVLSYPWLPGRQPLPRETAGSISISRDMITQGGGVLGRDGSFTLEFEAAPTGGLSDQNFEYEITAHVTDLGRGDVSASTTVLATWAELSAAVFPDAPWYPEPRGLQLHVRTSSATGTPASVAGTLTVSRLRYGGENVREVSEEEVGRWPAQTDPQGRLSVAFTPPSGGQYRVCFATKDSQGNLVASHAVFWVLGGGFEGKRHRFHEVEIISDRASYQPGDTARLLVATQTSSRRILFSEDAREGSWLKWRSLSANGQVCVVEVPVEARHAPQLNFEAVLVSAGRLHTATATVEVAARARREITVTLQTDRLSYPPGGEGRLVLEAREADGRPVSGEAAVAVSDAAVEGHYARELDLRFEPDRRRDRWHQAVVVHSLGQGCAAADSYRAPSAGLGLLPEWDRGIWPIERYGRLLGGVDFGRRPRGAEFEDRAGRRGAFQSTSAGDYAVEPLRTLTVGRYLPSGAAAEALPVTVYSANVLEPKVRTNFLETAVWLPKVVFGPDGRAEAAFQLPEALTRWNFTAAVITPDTRTAIGKTSVVTTKKVLVRLQAPRFFIERDEVVLSAVAHNDLAAEQLVRGDLLVPAELFEPLGEQSHEKVAENLVLRAEAKVAAGTAHRFDWRLRALQPGLARVTAKALTSVESDATEMSFPLFVHGIEQQTVHSGSYRPRESGRRRLTLDVPEEVDPARTRLEVSLTSSLAGVISEALPFLAEYPHECVEQTTSRFYPAAVVAALQHKLGGPAPGSTLDQRRLIREGLRRLAKLAEGGGWGWWGGDSSPYQTAYVLQALDEAVEAGVDVGEDLRTPAAEYLRAKLAAQMSQKGSGRVATPSTLDAFIAYALSRHPEEAPELGRWLRQLHAGRAELNPQGKALLVLALHRRGLHAEAALGLENLLQFLERDDAQETAWIRTPAAGWWFWHQNEIETNAWALRALVALRPQSELAPRLVKWLVHHRAGGRHWRSTRDTALVIAALAHYLRGSGEAGAETSVTLQLDDGPVQTLAFDRSHALARPQSVSFSGAVLSPGRHTLDVGKSGPGTLYYSARLVYFSKAPEIAAAGDALVLERRYFKVPTGREASAAERVPLLSGEKVASGQEIEVVLTLRAKDGCDFLALEDRKPAGCEPIEVASGSRLQDGLSLHVELREAKTIFYLEDFGAGEQEFRYRLRAEVPGLFRAPPATVFGMYAPERRGNSGTMRLEVTE